MPWRSALSILLLLVGCSSPPRSESPSPTSSISPATTQASSTHQPTPLSNEPLSKQLARASEKLHGKRFSGLLYFEKDADTLFVTTDHSAPPRIDNGDRYTGKSSLALTPNTQGLTIKLSSLLAGREFPGDWTLLGLYVRSDQPAGLSLSCERDGRMIAGRKVRIPAGPWTAAMIDLAALPATTSFEGNVTLELRFDEPPGAVRIDDLLLIDNRETLVNASPDGWTIKRDGLRVTCERKLRFNFSVVTRDGSPDGWEVEEANDLRARFSSSGAEGKALTVYTDGRLFWDGAYKPQSVEVRNDRSFAAAHASPAEIVVPETMGRVHRSTPGDANNDGYNELLGAYQLEATGGRIELTITPRGAALPRPVLQVAGMPQGKSLITIEGRLVERSTRLDDGTLLVELPARITRPTLVAIRIQ
jgi:hypothetical protein